MPKANLTAAFCLTAQCQPGRKRTDYYDIGTTGFVLACLISRTMTYEFRYTDQYGKLKQRRIAPYGDITFAEAQKIAKRWRCFSFPYWSVYRNSKVMVPLMRQASTKPVVPIS